VAHIGDPSDVRVENAVWLCSRHHGRYDTRSRQLKGHTPDELRVYRTQLYEYMATGEAAWPDAHVKRAARRTTA
jgi:Rieske Fe-S protein